MSILCLLGSSFEYDSVEGRGRFETRRLDLATCGLARPFSGSQQSLKERMDLV